ncbi:MAG: 2-octaprenyl-6-methoxyphenol hydroxylase [Halieaceae bacterium]
MHILIAGGGMVGLSLALLLHRDLPSTVRITLVEGVALPDGAPRQAYHPSFDARSTALSYSSASLYRKLGLWRRLEPGLAPIRHIHVSRRGRFGSSVLSAGDQGWDALGWVVENPCLGQALLEEVRSCEGVELRCPARVTGAVPHEQGVSVSVDGQSERADLLIIADGAESALRDGLGFFTRRKRYGQRALIANLAFEHDHRGYAYERFTASGPLALLPLPATADSAHRMALVWTAAPDRANALLAMSEQEFGRALVDAFGYRLGRPLKVGARQAYPLALTEAVEQVRRGMVVLGNAAHALHPVAGQGFNLAVRDAAALSRALAAALASGCSPGDTAVLGDYCERRQRDQAQTIAASDGLPALFMAADPLLALSRDLALSGLDVLPVLRRLFVKEAAGMAALEAGHG